MPYTTAPLTAFPLLLSATRRNGTTASRSTQHCCVPAATRSGHYANATPFFPAFCVGEVNHLAILPYPSLPPPFVSC